MPAGRPRGGRPSPPPGLRGAERGLRGVAEGRESLDAQRLNLRMVLTLADGERLDINPDNSWQVIYAV